MQPATHGPASRNLTTWALRCSTPRSRASMPRTKRTIRDKPTSNRPAEIGSAVSRSGSLSRPLKKGTGSEPSHRLTGYLRCARLQW